MLFTQPTSWAERSNLSLSKLNQGIILVFIYWHTYLFPYLRQMSFQVTIIFSGAKLFLQINRIVDSFSSHLTDDFKHSLLNAKVIDIQLSLQLQTEPIRDEVCTYGKATLRRFQKSLNYNQMVFLHNYFPRINVSGRQSNILLASRHYKMWNFNCIICRQPNGNPGMYVFNGSSNTVVKK